MAEKSVPVSAYLEPQLFDTFKRLADEQERSVSWLVGFAIKQYIASRAAPHVERVLPRQVHLEDAIVAAVKRGPLKVAKHK
jgi:predicted transcriptional regulator